MKHPQASQRGQHQRARKLARQGKSDCNASLTRLAEELREMEDHVHSIRSPLCPPATPDGIALQEWERKHAAVIEQRIGKISQAAARVAQRNQLGAMWAKARAPRPLGGPQPCLSCVPW